MFGNSAGTGTGNNGAGGGFGAYAKGGAQGFAIPAAKRARAGSPIGNGSETSLADPETSNAKKEERERSESRNGRKSEEGSEEGVEGDEKDKDKNEESRRSESRTREGSTFGEKLRAERDSDKEIADGENEDGYVWGEGRKKGTLEEKESEWSLCFYLFFSFLVLFPVGFRWKQVIGVLALVLMDDLCYSCDGRGRRGDGTSCTRQTIFPHFGQCVEGEGNGDVAGERQTSGRGFV